MHSAAQAYGKIASATVSPRELEASLLLKAAAKLQRCSEEWGGMNRELDEALTYNRKLWTILMTAATKAENPLPRSIKQNVANLGIFILNHTMRTMTSPDPSRLEILVSINKDIAAGLRSM